MVFDSIPFKVALVKYKLTYVFFTEQIISKDEIIFFLASRMKFRQLTKVVVKVSSLWFSACNSKKIKKAKARLQVPCLSKAL